MSRASRSEMEQRHAAIAAVVAEVAPATVRQVFYQCVVRAIVGKTEADYDKVQRALLGMRRDGIIAYGDIIDASRMRYMPTVFASPEEAMRDLGRRLRLDLWRGSMYRIEFWLEKLALEAVVSDVTWRWGVPLYVSRGFSSESYLYEAAEDIAQANRDTHVFLLTDHDPSGLKIEAAIRERLPRMVALHGGQPGRITFRRLGLTEEQIRNYDLPSRPTKASSHAVGFAGDSTELDALHPDVLRAVIEAAIMDFVDHDHAAMIEAEEREARTGLMATDFTQLMRHAAQTGAFGK